MIRWYTFVPGRALTQPNDQNQRAQMVDDQPDHARFRDQLSNQKHSFCSLHRHC